MAGVGGLLGSSWWHTGMNEGLGALHTHMQHTLHE